MILAKAKVQTTIKALVVIATRARVIQVLTTLTMTEVQEAITPEATTIKILESQTLTKTLGALKITLEQVTKRALMTKIRTMVHQKLAQQAMPQPHPPFHQVWV